MNVNDAIKITKDELLDSCTDEELEKIDDLFKSYDYFYQNWHMDAFAFIDNKLEFDIKIKPHTKEETLKYLSLVDNCIKNEKDLSKKIIPNENLKYIEPEIIQTKTNKKSYEEEM